MLRRPRRADISGLSDPHQILRCLAELGGQPCILHRGELAPHPRA
jgi:hypothetical protein